MGGGFGRPLGSRMRGNDVVALMVACFVGRRRGARGAQSVHVWMHFRCKYGASRHPMALNEGRFRKTFGFPHARE